MWPGEEKKDREGRKLTNVQSVEAREGQGKRGSKKKFMILKDGISSANRLLRPWSCDT